MSVMNREKVMEITPHRDPILLVDEVTEMVQGESIVAKFYIDPDREVLKGHFPGNPVWPGVYTVESMAQAAGLLFLSMEKYKNKTPLFIGIDKVKFIKKIGPGDTLEIRVKKSMERPEKAIVACSAEVFTNGEIAASGEVSLALR